MCICRDLLQKKKVHWLHWLLLANTREKVLGSQYVLSLRASAEMAEKLHWMHFRDRCKYWPFTVTLDQLHFSQRIFKLSWKSCETVAEIEVGEGILSPPPCLGNVACLSWSHQG